MRYLCIFVSWLVTVTGASAAVPVYDVDIVHSYPHDRAAYTEGLFYLDGFLYESTGLEQHSSIRRVRLETGAVLQKTDLPGQYFGEGIVNWGHQIISLTWKDRIGFVFDRKTMKLETRFQYPGEGWALTQDGKQLIMSDGTPALRFLDPRSLKETHRLEVTLDGKPLSNVNELEWVKGEILANVWQTTWIVRIDPGTGHVLGLINLSRLLSEVDSVNGPDSVLNGIAYDAKGDRLFVTGKNWPKLFEIRVHEHADAAASMSSR